MEPKVDLYRTMLNLAETTGEALEHIYLRTMDGRFEDTGALFTDVADSFHEMQKGISGCMTDLQNNDLEAKADRIVEGMRMLLSAYEGDQEIRPMVVLQFSLLPAYKAWSRELQETMGESCATALN